MTASQDRIVKRTMRLKEFNHKPILELTTFTGQVVGHVVTSGVQYDPDIVGAYDVVNCTVLAESLPSGTIIKNFDSLYHLGIKYQIKSAFPHIGFDGQILIWRVEAVELTVAPPPPP